MLSCLSLAIYQGIVGARGVVRAQRVQVILLVSFSQSSDCFFVGFDIFFWLCRPDSVSERRILRFRSHVIGLCARHDV